MTDPVLRTPNRTRERVIEAMVRERARHDDYYPNMKDPDDLLACTCGGWRATQAGANGAWKEWRRHVEDAVLAATEAARD